MAVWIMHLSHISQLEPGAQLTEIHLTFKADMETPRSYTSSPLLLSSARRQSNLQHHRVSPSSIMRLLHAETKKLVEFCGDFTPRYAILSHTWHDNERTYRDIPASGIVLADEKIDGCCRQALANRLEYVWIDTICIDKSSSSELSEAINSMFA